MAVEEAQRMLLTFDHKLSDHSDKLKKAQTSDDVDKEWKSFLNTGKDFDNFRSQWDYRISAPKGSVIAANYSNDDLLQISQRIADLQAARDSVKGVWLARLQHVQIINRSELLKFSSSSPSDADPAAQLRQRKTEKTSMHSAAGGGGDLTVNTGLHREYRQQSELTDELSTLNRVLARTLDLSSDSISSLARSSETINKIDSGLDRVALDIHQSRYLLRNFEWRNFIDYAKVIAALILFALVCLNIVYKRLLKIW